MHVRHVVMERLVGNLALFAGDHGDTTHLNLPSRGRVTEDRALVSAAQHPLGDDLIAVGKALRHVDRDTAHPLHLGQLPRGDRLLPHDRCGEEWLALRPPSGAVPWVIVPCWRTWVSWRWVLWC